MFNRDDYWPYMIGVFTLGGLVAVPLVWGQFIDLPYDRLVVGSLLACGVFAYAHTRDGTFSIGRFLLGFGFIFLMSLRIAASSRGSGAFIPGGFLGFVVMAGSGWTGIGIARALGVSHSVAKRSLELIESSDCPDSTIRLFMESTYEAWKSVSHPVFENIRDNMDNISRQEFVDNFMNDDVFMGLMHSAFSEAQLRDGEFLVEGDEETLPPKSYVLTNCRLVLFVPKGGGVEFTARHIPVRNIASVKTQQFEQYEGMISVTLKSGEKLESRGLRTVPEEWVIEWLVQKESKPEQQAGTPHTSRRGKLEAKEDTDDLVELAVEKGYGTKEFVQFMERSYDKWKQGTLLRVAPDSVEETISNSFLEFLQKYKHLFPTMETAMRKRRFGPGEYWVCTGEDCFVLTNKMLYLIEQIENGKSVTTIPLAEVQEYWTEGWWSYSMFFRMKSGTLLKHRGYDRVPKEEHVNAFKG